MLHGRYSCNNKPGRALAQKLLPETCECGSEIYLVTNGNDEKDKDIFGQILNNVTNIHDRLVGIKHMADERMEWEVIWREEELLHEDMTTFLEVVTSWLPELKCIFLEWTDAGPGDGITNHAVKYRIAQMARIFNADYFVKHHLSNGDSSYNEIERCQGYIGNAIHGGGPLEWEYRKFDYNSDAINNMSLEFVQNVESKRMHYNATKVYEEVALRVDGSPVPGGYLTAYKSDGLDEMFFTDAEFFQAFIKSLSSNKPGSTYYKKLQSFLENHFFIGMKFVEFIKCEAAYEDDCSYCSDNPRKIETIKRCPRPEPDHSQLPEFHYKRQNDASQCRICEQMESKKPF